MYSIYGYPCPQKLGGEHPWLCHLDRLFGGIEWAVLNRPKDIFDCLHGEARVQVLATPVTQLPVDPGCPSFSRSCASVLRGISKKREDATGPYTRRQNDCRSEGQRMSQLGNTEPAMIRVALQDMSTSTEHTYMQLIQATGLQTSRLPNHYQSMGQ